MRRAISLRAGAAGAQILGFGDYRPRRIVTNEELSQRVDTTDKWIRARVGISERRFAADDESLVDMSVAAAGKALAASGIDAVDIDTVILATCTPPAPIPGLAPEIAYRLGTHAPGAFDINAACAGFCYGLSAAADAIHSGSSQRTLVIGAEKLTSWTDQDDRGTCIIFGDGAGAAVVVASDTPGIGPVVWGSEGDKSRAISIADRASFMEMDGRAVYRWATTRLAGSARKACELAGLDISDIDVFVPHQANLRIVDSMVRGLRLGDNVAVARDIVYAGNTSSASIPLALTAMIERGEVKTGDTALLLGFGAGLTYAGQVITCP